MAHFSKPVAGIVVACVVIIPATAQATEEAPGQATLLVTPIRAERDIEPGLIRLLDELVLTEFQKSGKYQVIGAADVVAMLNVEKQKQLVGCADDNCLAEIGGALGAQFLATSSIGRVGDFYLLNVKLIDVETAIVVDRWSEQIEGVENKLVDAVRKGIGAVTGEERASVRAEREATAGLRTAAWMAGGVGAATFITGVILGTTVESKLEYSPYDQRFDDGVQSGRDRALVTNIMLGVSAAATAAAVTLFVLGYTGGPSQPEAKVVPVASPAGAGLIVRF